MFERADHNAVAISLLLLPPRRGGLPFPSRTKCLRRPYGADKWQVSAILNLVIQRVNDLAKPAGKKAKPSPIVLAVLEELKNGKTRLGEVLGETTVRVEDIKDDSERIRADVVGSGWFDVRSRHSLWGHTY